MKETLNISIANVAFTIDIEAYEKLNSYLDTLTHQFESQGDEGAEIIADIEARIAEILLSEMRSHIQVVSLFQINSIIAQMGYPESEESSEDQSREETRDQQRTVIKKKLYRKKEGAMVGGVLNGLATYLGTEVVILRLLYIAVIVIILCLENTIRNIDDFVGYLFIAYFIMYIIVPRAKTTLQKLEMEGEIADINTISEIRSERNEEATQSKTIVDRILSFIGSIIKIILLVVRRLILFILALIIIIAIGFIAFAINNTSITSILYDLNPSFSIFWITVIPISLFVILSLLVIKWIFKVKISKWVYIGLTALFLVSLTINGSNLAFSNFNEHTTLQGYNQTIYEQAAGKKLYIGIYSNGNETKNSFDKNIFYKKASCKFIESEEPEIKVVLKRVGSGYDYHQALDNSKTIELPYKVKGDTLLITTGFTKDSFRSSNSAHYTIYHPKDADIEMNRQTKFALSIW